MADRDGRPGRGALALRLSAHGTLRRTGNADRDEQAINAFWDTFVRLEGELARTRGANTSVYDELLAALRRVHPGLYIEFATTVKHTRVRALKPGEDASELLRFDELPWYIERRASKLPS